MSEEPKFTSSDIKVRTRKDIHNKSNNPDHNHDRKDRPPVNNHLVDPSNENPKEEEKTEFNGINGGMCQNQIRSASFVKSMLQKVQKILIV